MMVLDLFGPVFRLATFLSLGVQAGPDDTLARASAEPAVAAADFFAGQGCAIGPSTRAAALSAGVRAEDIDALARQAGRHDDTVQTGDWLVLPPDMCRIRPPTVAGSLAPDAPEVVQSLSAPDEYLASDGLAGCFLDTQALVARLQQTRSWDEETANREYLRMAAAALASGEMTFYSDSPLRTPMGLQSVTGACADIPDMPEIARSHDFLLDNFDFLVRTAAERVECGPGATLFDAQLGQLASELPGGEGVNAWHAFEIMVMAMGAGWYEGMTFRNKGMPRPPLCHYR